VDRDSVHPMLVEGSLIYDARDEIARYAVENDYDYVLYADSDMVFTADDVKRIVSHNADICSGLYVTRHGENNNVCYSKVITRRNFPFREPKLIVDTATTGYSPVEAVGFGFCLVKCSVIKTMLKRYKSLFEPKWGVGEDIAFCIRAKKCGYSIFTDRDVKLGHIGEVVYGE
jgi:cellulose synthase/poly-beta-1,6-N-acetylglucosamine synthase-like glycosyltransferase